MPELVLYDDMRDVIYVANINGNPSEKDGNGFISILNTMEVLKIRNGYSDGKLYVSNID